MSSIEKAMDRLTGKARAEPDEDLLETETSTRDDRPEQDSVDAGGPDTMATPDQPQKQSDTADTPAEPVHARKDGADVWIDFDFLRESGHLTPDSGHTREGEEYQHIKRRLLGNVVLMAGQADAHANLIMITSSVPGEGKTFTSLNLAMSISMEMDHTILVVDTDLMKRDLSRKLNLVEKPGLFDYLEGRIDDVSDIIYRTNRHNLAVVPAGQYTSSSTELVASSRMERLVDEFSTRYSDRIVLFDTPPLLATTTAVALAPRMGQLLLVVEAGETRATTLEQALRTIDRTPVTGLILNKAKAVGGSPYDYYSYYYRPTGQGV